MKIIRKNKYLNGKIFVVCVSKIFKSNLEEKFNSFDLIHARRNVFVLYTFGLFSNRVPTFLLIWIHTNRLQISKMPKLFQTIKKKINNFHVFR